ncbi:LuxR C-terminal-related transcriptional regulator [Chloroflexota bacterium]
MSGKLTLVSAPAGFGKTTFLSNFIHQCHRPVAWITLDQGDNDKNRLLTYFIAALKNVSDGFGQSVQGALQANQPSGVENILSGLIYEIIEIHKPFILVFDDYHHITNPEIHEITNFIIENQPPDMHLVISSRSDPPWPLARYRARQEMTEIRAQDLRFKPAEAAALLNDILHLDLSDDDILRLDAKTEGWIAGLLMAAISVQGRENISGFIQGFEGSHRFIFDYLVEEVLNQLPPDLQDFLLKTSILDRLCAPLCNTILERDDSQSFLQQIEKMNLYIFPLDDHRYWYRYHRLFSDLLVSLLKELRPEEVKQLHCRASIWYESNDLLSEAVGHAFKADDIQRVVHLAQTNVLGLMEQGELGMLLKWIDRLPKDVVNDYPWLQVAQAWALTQSGSLAEALTWASSAESSLEGESGIPEHQIRHISGHIAAIRCYAEFLSFGDYGQATRYAQKALTYLPDTDMRTRGMVLVLLGMMLRVQQDFSAALETLNSALRIYQAADQPYVVIDILSQIARVRREQSLLHETARLCQEALAISDQYAQGGLHRLSVAAYTMGILGRVYYEWNQLDRALDIGLQALALSERWGQANTLLGNHLFLARIYRVKGRFQAALESIRAARISGGRFSDTHEFVIRTHEITVRLAMGDIQAVEQWVEHESTSFDVSRNERIWELRTLILALYRQKPLNDLDDLLLGLDQLLEIFEKSGSYRRSLQTHIEKTMIYQALGDNDRALIALDKALSMGELEGYVRSFLDQGPPMAKLLKMAISSRIKSDYVNRLLTALSAEQVSYVGHPDQKLISFVEELTNRETEVLRLLSTKYTIPEIADELVITTGTLRTHIKRIYSKMNVHSRFEAVTRAKEAQIL